MKQINTISECQKTGFFSQFTEEQLRNQYKANAAQLRKMSEVARKKGKKIGGYTAEQWAERADHFEKIANS